MRADTQNTHECEGICNRLKEHSKGGKTKAAIKIMPQRRRDKTLYNLQAEQQQHTHRPWGMGY